MEFEVRVAGTPDATTGYLVGIDRIDACVRRALEGALPQALADGASPATALVTLMPRLAVELGLPVRSVAWRPHPFLQVTVEESMLQQALITHRFDFAASHRLHCPSLDDASNRRIFGKCNNPAGHGHNYRLEVEVRVPMEGPEALRGQEIARIVREHAVDRLDHKHLNADVAEFRDRNPSVEHIAQVCFQWLQQPLRSSGAELARVRLWETEKTSAIYPG